MVLHPWKEVKVTYRLVVHDALPVEKDITFSFGNPAGTLWLPAKVSMEDSFLFWESCRKHQVLLLVMIFQGKFRLLSAVLMSSPLILLQVLRNFIVPASAFLVLCVVRCGASSDPY
jgi:hypothetical protein